MSVKPINCGVCNSRHGERFLCDPGKAILEAMVARAREVDMPTIDFAESPIPTSADIIMRQITVMGATIPIGDSGQEVKFPALVISGLDQHSKPLPKWTYPSDPANMVKLRALFTSRIDLAIAAAKS